MPVPLDTPPEMEVKFIIINTMAMNYDIRVMPPAYQ